ncbi:MAG: ribosome-associated translation inhibitor RaiA [Clostridia bacterium]|jgi:putative sigma-54 modulation protein|nr:ribosome-associated translation inhibitor RaiA [Clostridia bacterium]MBQ4364811.1 ribosome-associated translation inhibitor RaiA [Clostridia bacterium]MBR3095212.1 ribosome-associated translation inhibitor RaiA [Clostridia bacterium]
MKITVIGRKCTPRDSFKDRAEKRLRKVEKFFPDEVEAKVTAIVEKSEQIVEVTIFHDGMIFRSQERAINMNDALDRCVDSLVRQIRKNKTRVEKKLRSGAFDAFDAIDTMESEDTYDVVRSKEIVLKPQSVEEAILQMNLLDHQFYMFRNSTDEKICLVYARKDGGYGLLVPAED